MDDNQAVLKACGEKIRLLVSALTAVAIDAITNTAYPVHVCQAKSRATPLWCLSLQQSPTMQLWMEPQKASQQTSSVCGDTKARRWVSLRYWGRSVLGWAVDLNHSHPRRPSSPYSSPFWCHKESCKINCRKTLALQLLSHHRNNEQ